MMLAVLHSDVLILTVFQSWQSLFHNLQENNRFENKYQIHCQEIYYQMMADLVRNMNIKDRKLE